MELNGMCLIWGWQSSNCFLFELLPAWLGTAVIETIMFHSSLGIICLESSFNSVLLCLLKPLPLPLQCSQGLHLFCVLRFWPDLGNSNTPGAWSWCFPGPAPSAPSCFGHRLLFSSGHRAPFIQPQVSALPLAQSSGEHILTWLFKFPFKVKNVQQLCEHFIWCDHDYPLQDLDLLVLWELQMERQQGLLFLPSEPCFAALWGSFTQYRSGCGSAVHLQRVANILPYSQHSPFISNF